MSLTAGTSSHVLLKAVKRAGWGNLAGPDFRGVRGVYATLIEILDGRSGEGRATVWQIAEQAGYGERWTRRCLKVLEELELIEWDRGGVVDGKPVPSWFRVSKRALLILVSIARTVSGERHAARQVETRERIARYRLNRTKRRHKRRSRHAALVPALLSIEEVPREAGPPLEAPQVTPEAKSDALAQIRAALRAQRGLRTVTGSDSKSATTRRAANDSALVQR